MKSVVNQEQNKSDKPFPKLMKSKNRGQIVLFTSAGVGTCVNAGESTCKLGEVSDAWLEDNFHDFTGTVTLSND